MLNRQGCHNSGEPITVTVVPITEPITVLKLRGSAITPVVDLLCFSDFLHFLKYGWIEGVDT